MIRIGLIGIGLTVICVSGWLFYEGTRRAKSRRYHVVLLECGVGGNRGIATVHWSGSVAG